MKAKDLNARVSVKGSNVVKVRKWKLLVEAVLATGERLSFHPEQTVRVMPERDARGQFLPRNYLIMAVIDGLDVVFTVTGRKIARDWLAGIRSDGDTATIVAL